MRPASTTKVMTALLALERGNLEDIIVMSHAAVFSLGRGAAHIALDEGEEITLEAAMYALSIRSANDATNGVAEHIGGTMSGFNALMNERAVEAGAKNTNFTNAHGMPDDDHLSTAYDLAKILMAAVNTPGFNRFFSARSFTMPPTNKQEEPRFFNSRNPMLAGNLEYEGIIAEKTGWTIASQHTLVTAAERDGRRLICVVLKSPDRDDKYKDTALLLDYGFENFTRLDYTAGELQDIANDGKIAGDFSLLVPNGMTKQDVDIRHRVIDDDENRSLHRFVFALEPSDSWYAGLGELEYTVVHREEYGEPVEAFAEITGDGDETGPGGLVLRWIARIFAVIIGLCAVMFIYLLLLRWVRIRRYRRRHRGRRLFR
jgi:D-alanyl-D-alanine carboxypeptidase